MTDQPDTPPAEAGTTTDETPRCAYPGCGSPPEPKAAGTTGPAPKYCDRSDHTALTAYRARKRADAPTTAAVPQVEDDDRPVTSAAAQAITVREDLATGIERLRTDLERYVTLLQTIGDPEAAEAQMVAVGADAESRIATATNLAAGEKNRRLNAEAAQRAAEDAKNAAERARVEAESAADEAIAELAAATERFATETGEIREQSDRQVVTAQEEFDRQLAVATEEFATETAEIRRLTEAEVSKAQQDAADAEVERDRVQRESAAEVAEAKERFEQQLADAQQAFDEKLADAIIAKENAKEAAAAATARATAADELMSGLRNDLEALREEVRGLRARATDLEGQLSTAARELSDAKDEVRAEKTARERDQIRIEELERQLAAAKNTKGGQGR